jgi:hypothetical protein
MTVVAPGGSPPASQEPHAITLERVECLTSLLTEPTDHIQRFIEQVSFAPNGGQRWVRRLQIQIPRRRGASVDLPADWQVVPLGPFARRRFADITVTDSSGHRLNLVTRDQHGELLARVALTKHFSNLPQFDPGSRGDMATVNYERLYKTLRKQLYDYYTEINSTEAQRAERETILNGYEQLLELLGVPDQPDSRSDSEDSELTVLLKAFSDDLMEASDSTQYLCWIHTRPGTVENLEVSYTTEDPKHKLEDGDIRDLLRVLRTGIFGIFGKSLDERREVWNRWYTQYGLAPILYAFNIPTYEYTASHYSTIEPPANTHVTYLDWERSNSRDSKEELASSLAATHIFNNAQDAGTRKRVTTHAYLRCTPHQHKQILGVAFLNLVLVGLLAVGRFPSIGSPLQDLLAAAPAILIAFIAQRQRHYYAHALRRSRGVLWTYLFVEVTFLVAVAFSGRLDGLGTPGLGWKAATAARVLAVTSVLVMVWQAPLGNSYERVVGFLMNRKEKRILFGSHGYMKYVWLRRWRDKIFGLKWREIKTDWQLHEAAVEQYCRLIRFLLVAGGAMTLVLLMVFWHPAPPVNRKDANPHMIFTRTAEQSVPAGHLRSDRFRGSE